MPVPKTPSAISLQVPILQKDNLIGQPSRQAGLSCFYLSLAKQTGLWYDSQLKGIEG